MHNNSLLRNKRSRARTTCLKEMKEENLCVCLFNQSHSRPNTWLPIDVNNEPMKHLLVKHFKMYKALRLKYVHKREIMSLK
jgi:hypothetical protein